MRMQGKRLAEDYRRQVMLPRPDGSVWALTIQPLRLGFQQWLKERGILTPAVPRKLVRDSSGKPLRDAEGLVLTQRDEAHPDYEVAVEQYHQRMAALMIWEGLKADDNIQFETPLPEEQEVHWSGFADAVLQELDQAGFTAGDLVWLCEQIALMSHLVKDHLQTEQQNFFSANAEKAR